MFTSEQLFNGYSEETLTFAIIVTAFVALLLGIFLGVFVTRFCASPSSQKTVQRESNSSEDINRYSVTTLSRYINLKRTFSLREEYSLVPNSKGALNTHLSGKKQKI